MRLFDSFVTQIIITILSIGVAIVNVFLIYTIFNHSPKSMGKFKSYMMIMSTADFLFASSIAFLFQPNLLFPLPAGITTGLLKYLGHIGGPIAYSISMTTGGWMMASIAQCCVYRLYVFYDLSRPLDIANRYFKPLMILEVLVIASVVNSNTYINLITYEELVDYAKRHGHTVPADLTRETPFVAFDLEKPNVIVGLITIGGFLFLIGICILGFNLAVQKKINETKSSMSKESYSMQKSLTVILLAQAIIPGISIAIPVIIYCVAMGFILDAVLRSPIVEWFSVLIIGAYPFANSSFCLYYMKPYRKFTKRILQKIFWCYPWKEETVAIANPTSSSNT